MLFEIRNVVAFTAHVADAFQRCGGTLLNYLRKDYNTKIVSLAYGEVGESPMCWMEKGMTVEKAKEVKRLEVEKAAKILGVEIRILDFGDNPIHIDWSRMRILIDTIRELKPHIILTHFIYENYEDHRLTAQRVVEAINYARLPGIATNHPPHRDVRAIYMFTPARGHSVIVGFKPDIYIDISDAYKVKRDALKCFKSQSLFRGVREDLSVYFVDIEGPWRGYESRVKYAEGFMRYGLPTASKIFGSA